MKIQSTSLQGLYVVDTQPRSDARGSFERMFCEQDWTPLRPMLHFVQINLSSTSKRGTVRGLHFQRAPAAEAKLIRCIRGHVYDVAIDLRADSPSFLRWHAVELREDEPRGVFIPEGFAHGFQSLGDDAQLLYFHTAPWTPACEGGVRYDDPRLDIAWPLPVAHVSERDRGHPLIDDAFNGLRV